MKYNIIKNKAKCLLCGDVIESLHPSELVSCECGNICINGGKNNLRRYGIKDTFEELSEVEEIIENDQNFNQEYPTNDPKKSPVLFDVKKYQNNKKLRKYTFIEPSEDTFKTFYGLGEYLDFVKNALLEENGHTDTDEYGFRISKDTTGYDKSQDEWMYVCDCGKTSLSREEYAEEERIWSKSGMSACAEVMCACETARCVGKQRNG